MLNFSNSIIISKTNAETQVETILLTLTSLAYLIPKREDLTKLIDDTLSKHLLLILEHGGDFVKSRLCLLLG